MRSILLLLLPIVLVTFAAAGPLTFSRSENATIPRDANNSTDAAVLLKRDEWFKFKCWLGIDFEGDCSCPGAVC